MVDEEGEVYVVGCDPVSFSGMYWLIQLPSTAWGATMSVPVTSYNIFDQEFLDSCPSYPRGDLYTNSCGDNALIISGGDNLWYWAVNGSDVAGALTTPGTSLVEHLYDSVCWSDDGSKFYNVRVDSDGTSNLYVHTRV
jgi:hypothetical protein